MLFRRCKYSLLWTCDGKNSSFESTCGQCSQCSHALPSFLLLAGLLLGSKQFRGSVHERMRARFSISFVWLTYKLSLKCQGLKRINLSCQFGWQPTNRQPFGLVWWEKVWPSWPRCPLCPRHQVWSVGLTNMAGHQCIISAKDYEHLSIIVFQVRAGVCRQLFCEGKWKLFPRLSSLDISCSERELLLVLDQCSEWCVRLLGEVRNKQGGPELHGQGGSVSEYLREEDGGLLVVQGQRPRLFQLGLLFTTRAGPCINY